MNITERENKRDTNEIGCGPHIMNCLQCSYDALPIGVRALMVKICKYSYIYTVPGTKFYSVSAIKLILNTKSCGSYLSLYRTTTNL
jgi:hypothetical protein